MENKILDYEQVLSKLRKIENLSSNIKREEPIGYTTYKLPILHYTYGTGKNHIILTASQHGCEIISTDFLLKVMEKIADESERFKFLKENKCTLHFLPMLNPEGYLISTSALRRIIKRELPNDESQEIYSDYVEAYKKDDRDVKLKLNTKTKRHQQFFGHIDPYAILNSKFRDVQKSLIKMYSENNIPEGTLAIWHSNGNGVDLNQNVPYNPKIKAMQEGKTLYSILRYDNIETTKPGPIGCPMKGKKFEYEPENKAILNFISNLKNNKNIELCAYLNYHSTGGIVFHKPYKDVNGIVKEEKMKYMNLESMYNQKLAEIYCEKADYKVINSESGLNCFNDLLRLQVPGNLLIELSKTAGNPLSPYLDSNYDEIVENNLKALAYTLPKIPEMNRIKKEFIQQIDEKTYEEER